MIFRDDFSAFLNDFFEFQKFDDFCQNGLQVAGKSKIQKIAVGVSASKNFLKKAEKWGADAVFVHHGLFWGRGILAIDDFLKERLEILFRKKISLFAVHLPLDAHEKCGNNFEIARAFSLQNIQKKDFFVSGILPKKLSFSEFSEKCEKIFGQKPNFAGDFSPKKIQKIGICSGAGGDFLKHFSDIDAFLTGEIAERNWHEAREKKISLFAVGHLASERFGPRAFLKIAEKKFPQIQFSFFDEKCPV